MACNCFKDREEKYAKLAEEKTNKKFPDGIRYFKADFQNTVMHLGKGDFAPVTMYFETKCTRLKKSGHEYRNQTKSEFMVPFEYCPFCGTKFEGKEKA